ncbi:MAG: radical SAM protein [Candidatus Omnitrophota bacterium]|jgi:radical SAM superfamily enzyme YgiQ (UPF0313 family)|nr:MAG: radical SAM protein [Candidatus Omnitrophota bacterium]
MKIALVNLFYKHAMPCPPHGILSLISFLNKEFGDKIKVRYFDELPGVDIKKAVMGFNPEFIGISSFTRTINRAYELADYFRKKTDSIVALGGLHPSILPEESAKYADYVIVGEGEKGLASLIGSILEGKRHPGQLIFSEAIENLDSLPQFPWDVLDRDYYSESSQYTMEHFGLQKSDKYVALLTSRGCPYRCMFCYSSKSPTRVRYFSSERIISDIEYFLEEWKVNYFIFSDDDFLSNKERLNQFCKLIDKKGLQFKWGCQANVDSVEPETLRLIKQHGCEIIAYGFESGSQKILNFLKGRRADIRDNKYAIHITKKAGIKVFGYIMLGVPTETLMDLFKTFYFTLFSPIDIISPGRIVVYPGTKLWDWCVEKNIFNESEIDFTKPYKYIYLNNKYVPEKFFGMLYYGFHRLAIPVKCLLQRKFVFAKTWRTVINKDRKKE